MFEHSKQQIIVTKYGIEIPFEPDSDKEIPHDCATAALFLSGIDFLERKLELGGLSFEDICKYVDTTLTIVGESDDYDPKIAARAQIISCKYRRKGSDAAYSHAHFAAVSKKDPNFLLQRPSYNSKIEVIPGASVLEQIGSTHLDLEFLIVYYIKAYRDDDHNSTDRLYGYNEE